VYAVRLQWWLCVGSTGEDAANNVRAKVDLRSSDKPASFSPARLLDTLSPRAYLVWSDKVNFCIIISSFDSAPVYISLSRPVHYIRLQQWRLCRRMTNVVVLTWCIAVAAGFMNETRDNLMPTFFSQGCMLAFKVAERIARWPHDAFLFGQCLMHSFSLCISASQSNLWQPM
jgi:hypothetical protein